MGFDYSTSTMHIYQQCRSPFFISGWQRDSERRTIKKRHRSNTFLFTLLICGLRQDCDRKPNTVNGLLFAKIHPNNSTLDVWASSTEKNLFMVERFTGFDSNRNMLRTAIKQGSGQLVQQRWQRKAEEQGKNIPGYSKSNGRPMGLRHRKGEIICRKEKRMNDTISRQAAIDDIRRWIGYIDEDMITRIQIGLKNLPSAEPEKPFVIKTNRFLKKDEREMVEKELYRKLSQEKMIILGPEMELLYPNRIRAKWVRNIHDKVICTQCGMYGDNKWNFCPNCGADMRGTDD